MYSVPFIMEPFYVQLLSLNYRIHPMLTLHKKDPMKQDNTPMDNFMYNACTIKNNVMGVRTVKK